MLGLRIAGVLAISALVASPVFAHHSAAGFDPTKTVTVQGTVVEFRWANPHSWLEMKVTNNKGAVEDWNIEMAGVGALISHGWTKKSVMPGDKIKLTGHPLKTGEVGAIFIEATLADGRVLGGGGGEPGAKAAGPGTDPFPNGAPPAAGPGTNPFPNGPPATH